MARLNNTRFPPRLLPKREKTPSDVEDHESEVEPAETLNRFSSPTSHSLAIEVESKPELEKIFNGSDVTQFLATSDLNQSLALGQQIIIQRSQIAAVVNTQCAWDISLVWKSIESLRAQRPNESAMIQKWQEGVSQQLKKDSKDITYYLRLAEKTLLRLSAYGKRIHDRWGVLPTQVLPRDKYNVDRPLSKQLLQQMASLADQVTREEGQRLLTNSIEKRTDRTTRSTHDRKQPYLTHSDVRAAINQQRAGKRTRIEEENGEEDAGIGARMRSTKRQKIAVDTKDGDAHDDDAPDAEAAVPSASDVPGDQSSRSSSLSPPPSSPREKQVLEEDVKLPSSPEVIIGEAVDDGDAHDFLDMSIELPRKAPTSTLDYESPRLPHLCHRTSSETSPTRPPSPPPPIRLAPGAENSPHQNPVPDSKEALATLLPHERLSSTVISEALVFCAPADCHVIDPLYFNSTFSDRSGLSRQLATSIKRILLPLHDSNLMHWTLAILDLENLSIFIYDSLARDQVVDSTLTHRLQKFAGGLAHPPKQWTVHRAKCPNQSNGIDCGIHVIANALFIMMSIDLPLAHDCNAWRLICRALLGESTQEIPLDVLDHFRSPASCGSADEVAGVRPYQLPNPGDSAIATGLRETIQLAQSNLAEVQAQQRKLQTLYDFIDVITKMIEAVRQRLFLEALSLSNQLFKDERLLADHAVLIQRFDTHKRDDPSSHDDLDISRADPASHDMLSALRATQETMTKHLKKRVRQKEAVHNRIAKLKNAVSMAQRIRAMYDQQLSLANKARRQTRETTQNWRDVVAAALSGLDQTLASEDQR